MTTFAEFLAGNVLALGVVALVAVLLAGIFAIGGGRRTAPTPTRPISTASELAASDRVAATDDPVAVVGTPDCESPLRTPFVDEPAVAYQIVVGGRFGRIATVGANADFSLSVDGTPVAVRPRPSATPVVDDHRHEHVRKGDSLDDFDSESVDELAAHDADRTRRSKLVSGRISPDGAPRTYRIRYVSPADEIAVVGRLGRDTGDWVLEPVDEAPLRYLDPGAILRSD